MARKKKKLRFDLAAYSSFPAEIVLITSRHLPSHLFGRTQKRVKTIVFVFLHRYFVWSPDYICRKQLYISVVSHQSLIFVASLLPPVA